MFTRRDALRSLLAAPLVLTPFGLRHASAQQRLALLDVRRQRQFVNRLPRPRPRDTGDGSAALRARGTAVPRLARARRPAHGARARDHALGLRRPVPRSDLRRAARRARDRTLDQRARRGRALPAPPAAGRPLDPHRAHEGRPAGRRSGRDASARRPCRGRERRRSGSVVHAGLRRARAGVPAGGVPLRERPGGRHALVPRPCAGADAAQRRRRARGFLSRSRRERGPARAPRPAPSRSRSSSRTGPSRRTGSS